MLIIVSVCRVRRARDQSHSRGRPVWGYACVFAHVVIIDALCAFCLIAKTFNTPEHRATQQQKWLERRASRQAPRPLGGIDISRDSAFYKVAM